MTISKGDRLPDGSFLEPGPEGPQEVSTGALFAGRKVVVFHDYKKAGVDAGRLGQWVDEHGWETVLNRAGTTFKKLPDADKADIDKSKAIALMTAQPSMIKRPVLDLGDRRLVGFKPETYASAFT